MKHYEQDEPFDYRQHQFLGKYVYLLINPVDDSVFYVGQGLKERVGSHFEETRSAIQGKRAWTEKTSQIHKIWESGQEVKIAVPRKRLRDDVEASHIEGALIQTLTHLGYTLTNKVEAPKTNEHGWSDIEEIRREAAPPINPSILIDRVHLFKIENAVNQRIKNGGQIKDPELFFSALQKSWYRGKNMPNGGYAVGYIGSPAISVYACKIKEWVPCHENEGKWAIVREDCDSNVISELVEKNWGAVTTARGGAKYWATPAQVTFDGNGSFKFLFGVNDKTTLFSCVTHQQA